MHPTLLLALALSALPSTLSAPAPTANQHANDTLPLLPRGSWEGGDPKIASFTSPSCTTASRLGKYKSGWDCIKFTPGTDNVGINWGNTRAKGIDFFTDDNCNDYATKTVFSMDLGSDNGKGKADKCVSYRAHGGRWGSVAFVYPTDLGGIKE